MTLLLGAIIKFMVGSTLTACLLFLPAGVIFLNGLLFMGVLFIPMLILGVILFAKAPELLAKRLNGKEKQTSQWGIVALSGIAFLVGFILSGLDHRFGWSNMPLWISVTASVMLLLSYGLYAEVMRENAYLSRTIEVHQGQKVIDSGLYGLVRHPMYMATIVMFLMVPLVLGSYIALVVFTIYPVIIIFRIRGEEKLLENELEGYSDYMKRVKWRLIPFIW